MTDIEINRRAREIKRNIISIVTKAKGGHPNRRTVYNGSGGINSIKT